MRHRSKIKKFNRDTKSRKALFKNLVRSLVETGSITTTEAKAKETKRIADKLIGKSKTDTVATRRLLHRFFGTRNVVNTLVEKIAPEFSDRVSGFTTIAKVGLRRGDNTQLSKLSLVKAPESIGTLKSATAIKRTADKKVAKKAVTKAPAKKVVAKKTTPKKTAKKAVKKDTK